MNSNEISIRGFPNYTINKEGVVRNIKFDRIIKPQIASKGYYIIKMCKDGIPHRGYLHRLLAEHFIPNPDSKPQVNHINGNNKDNRLDNLEWNTAKENIQHAHRIGLCLKENKIKAAKASIQSRRLKQSLI